MQVQVWPYVWTLDQTRLNRFGRSRFERWTCPKMNENHKYISSGICIYSQGRHNTVLPCNTRVIHCQMKGQINKLNLQQPIKMFANGSAKIVKHTLQSENHLSRNFANVCTMHPRSAYCGHCCFACVDSTDTWSLWIPHDKEEAYKLMSLSDSQNVSWN
jgi:hypothetical protein